MIDHPSPPEILRALDAQLPVYLSVVFGGHDTALQHVPQLDTEGPPGSILTILINRYEEIVQHGALSDDTLLRPAIIASGILDLSRTDRCSRAQLRAALSLLDATEVPGYQQSRPLGRQVVLELAQPVVRQHGYDLIKECGVSFTLVA